MTSAERSAHAGMPQKPFLRALHRRWGGTPLARWEQQLIAARHDDFWPVRLWAEVLYDAYATIMRTPMWDRFSESLQWVRERDPSCALGTFDGVCLVLDLDAAIVRADIVQAARTKSLFARRRRAAK